jgi:hypothetical protein
MSESTQKILSIYDNHTDELIEKVDELKILLDKIQPILYIRKLSTEISKLTDLSVNLQKIDKELNFSDFEDSTCSVCFIKELTVQACINFIENLDKEINSKIEDYNLNTNSEDFINSPDFLDED